MPRPILLDTNVLLLLTVGLTSDRYISRHRRLAAYDARDFEIVLDLVDASSGMVFCPNVLTETSNFVRYTRDPMRSEIAAMLATLIKQRGERYVASSEAIDLMEYGRLGLTDTVLLALAETGATLLTDDLDLYLAAARKGLAVINYNHLREQREDYQ